MGKKGDVLATAQMKSFLDWGSPIKKALNLFASPMHPYRIVLVDEGGKFKGIISARRILEILLGKRGKAIREGKGVKAILNEPLRMIIDESHQVFTTDAQMSAILKFMVENMVGYVVVVDASNNYAGMVEEVDLLQRCRGIRGGARVDQVMKADPCVVPLGSAVLEATEMMLNERVRRLPVVSDGKVAGIITVSDVVRHIYSRTERLEALDGDEKLENLLSDPIEGIFSDKVIACKGDVDISEAIDIILDKDISGLVVMDDRGELRGIASRIDLMAGLVRSVGADALVGMMK